MPDSALIEDVEIARPGYTLPSTVCLPAGDGPAPCIVFFAGSGPTDRDWDADNVFRSNQNIRP